MQDFTERTDRKVKKRDVLSVLESRDKAEYPVMMVSDIADKCPGTHPIVGDRLKELEGRGIVKSRKAGQATLYWLSDEKMVQDHCGEGDGGQSSLKRWIFNGL